MVLDPNQRAQMCVSAHIRLTHTHEIKFKNFDLIWLFNSMEKKKSFIVFSLLHTPNGAKLRPIFNLIISSLYVARNGHKTLRPLKVVFRYFSFYFSSNLFIFLCNYFFHPLILFLKFFAFGDIFKKKNLNFDFSVLLSQFFFFLCTFLMVCTAPNFDLKIDFSLETHILRAETIWESLISQRHRWYRLNSHRR